MRNEEEMLRKIRESAQEIEAPETLSPDAVKKMLAEKKEHAEKEGKRRKVYFLRFGIGIAAAACAAQWRRCDAAAPAWMLQTKVSG